MLQEQTFHVKTVRTICLLAALPILALIVGSMMQRIFTTTNVQLFSMQFLSIFIEAIPFLLIGTLLSGFIEVFLRPENILRLAPKRVIPSVIAGAFMGFLFPVCECGAVPVVRRLLKKGLPLPMGIAMLLAAPVLNPIVLLSTYTAFGWGTVLYGRFLVTALTAMTAGLYVAKFEKGAVLLTEIEDHAHDMRGISFSGKIMMALSHSTEEFFEMGFFFTIGCLLATSIQHLLPQATLLPLGSGPVLSVLIMQLLAYVLSICSSVDAFVALGFAGTFSIGAVMSFLAFGAMIDIKSTLMFFSAFQKRTVLALILIPFGVTLASGILINLLHW